MKYKWGGLIEALEQAEGKHESDRLALAERKIRVLEETKTVEEARVMLLFLESDKDYLCSNLLDHMLEYFHMSTCLKYDDLEMYKFLEEREATVNIIEIIETGALQIFMYITRDSIEQYDINYIVYNALQKNQLNILKYLEEKYRIMPEIIHPKLLVTKCLYNNTFLDYYFDRAIAILGQEFADKYIDTREYQSNIPHIQALLYDYSLGPSDPPIYFIQLCGRKGLKFNECFSYFYTRNEQFRIQLILSYCDREFVKTWLEENFMSYLMCEKSASYVVKEGLYPVKTVLLDTTYNSFELFKNFYRSAQPILTKEFILQLLATRINYNIQTFLLDECKSIPDLTKSEILFIVKTMRYYDDCIIEFCKEKEYIENGILQKLDMENDIDFIAIACKNRNLISYLMKKLHINTEKYLQYLLNKN